MSIVQWYRSQAVIGGQLLPVPANGAMFDWRRNYVVPPIAGNDWPQNFHEGFQMPTVDLQLVSLDGESARNPFVNGILDSATGLAMARSGAANDIGSTTVAFFDGYSGYTGLKGKIGSFNLRGAKGEMVGLSMSLACYKLLADPAPTLITTAPAGTSAFTGAPLYFTSLQFAKNGSPLDGVYSFNLTYSNNLTPDMSMSGSSQQLFPVDINAGMPSVALQLQFQANSTSHVAAGDQITITVNQGSYINRIFTCTSFLPDTDQSRNIGSGRQMRAYSGQVVGTSNIVAPLIVT